MAFTNTKENGLESLIVKWLIEQNGYEEGINADYNKEYAVDEIRLFRFLQDTQPKEMDKLGVFTSDTKKRQFLNRLSGEIAKRGIIDVLRNGVKVYPADLIMFYLTPTENIVMRHRRLSQLSWRMQMRRLHPYLQAKLATLLSRRWICFLRSSWISTTCLETSTGMIRITCSVRF